MLIVFEIRLFIYLVSVPIFLKMFRAVPFKTVGGAGRRVNKDVGVGGGSKIRDVGVDGGPQNLKIQGRGVLGASKN